jgi:threonine dehydrogenase-like Zn-dependent dehydrogenase
MSAQSRAVVLERFGEPLSLQSFAVPQPGPEAALVRVAMGGICGTDAHLLAGHLSIPTPVVMGHEAVGEVAALGEGLDRDLLGRPLSVGDAVLWGSSIPCGRCYWCLMRGERTLCEHRRIYGINRRADEWPHLGGGWADFIYLHPATALLRLPEEVSPTQAIALGCAGPTVAHGLRRIAPVEPGDVVVVQGSGPVGVAAAMYARLAGAGAVLMVGGPAGRLERARHLGVADDLCDVFVVEDPAARARWVMDRTEGHRGGDLVVECTGVPGAVAEAIDMSRPAGTVLVLGQYTDAGPATINPHLITRKQLRVLGSWAFAESHFVDYVKSLPTLAARFSLETLVSLYPLDEANEALADMKEGRVMKAVLEAGKGDG